MTNSPDSKFRIQRLWPFMIGIGIILIILLYVLLKPDSQKIVTQDLALNDEVEITSDGSKGEEDKPEGVIKDEENAMKPMDFSPNPELDELMANLMRSNQTVRDMGAKFNSDEELNVYGTIMAEEASMDIYHLFIYSNDPDAFNSGKYIIKKKLSFLDEDFDYKTYNENIKTDWEPGLYYYVISKNEDPLFIGNIFKPFKKNDTK